MKTQSCSREEKKKEDKKHMLENFMYSINATIPIFVVMVAGYFLRRIGMLNEEFIRVANKFNFHVTLPFLVFQDLASADIRHHFDIRYVLYCAVVTSVCFWCLWFFARILLKDKSMVGAFVQASFRSSAAVLGLAFIQNMYGDSGMAPLMIVGAVPLYNIYSVMVLTFEGGKNPDGSFIDGASQEDFYRNLIRAGKNILKNPIIIAIFAGILGSLVNFYQHVPVLVAKPIASFASMASPLALVTIGAGFEGRKAIAKIKPALAASAVKLVIQPFLFLPVAEAMGFQNQELVAILIMLAAPATPSCYIMAKNMKNDGVLTTSVIVLTTLLSSITLTAWIYYLRSRGLLA